MPNIRSKLLPLAMLAATLALSPQANAQKREFSFAYDQPKTSGYGAGAEIFNKKLMELSSDLVERGGRAVALAVGGQVDRDAPC